MFKDGSEELFIVQCEKSQKMKKNTKIDLKKCFKSLKLLRFNVPRFSQDLYLKVYQNGNREYAIKYKTF